MQAHGFAVEWRHLAVDLQDASACADALSPLPDVTHVVYAALFEKPGLAAGWRERDQMDANLAMLRSALLALTPSQFPELPLKQVFEQLHSNPTACLRAIA